VGASTADAGASSGSAYVYTRSNGSWIQQTKLTASNAAAGDEFGQRVGISGDTVVVGAYQTDHDGPLNDAGLAYVFTRTGPNWNEQQILTVSDAAASDWFGVDVSISGDTVVVGSLSDDDNGVLNSGSAYIFIWTGTTWSEQQKLTASDPGENEYFGHSISMSGDTVVVGVPNDKDAGADTGSAYIFTRTGTTWN
jgi:hypothetical protein